ncbi:DUF262 domain-containing protein [Latilactobacillus sakei]|uniref:DUF262 domain-containing protein n=1 Tax=Latilactobacillus sakei TaxID=1599 RepID=UPI002073C852|nr:DUF262 domain-containing protein [Latilactobacillus sakei]USF97297.1 hypothetical protein A4W82_10565 [Latilactobacillus sakei]
MAFKAIGNSFKNLLTASRVYKIPDYQRDFSWDRSNYMVFLQDIISQLIAEQNDDDDNISVSFKSQPYYMGNMIFLGSDTDEEVDVVDGQQRITVTTILLAVIRDLFIEISTKVSVAKDYSDTIQSDYLVKKVDGSNVRKLKTTSSYPYFTKTIQDANSSYADSPNTLEEDYLKECYDDLKKNLSQKSILKNFSKYFDENKNSDEKYVNENYVNFLKAIRDQLLASEVVEIFVNDKGQAYKIFESINSKGKPLSQVDLIKNDVFSNLVSTTSLTNDGPEGWQKVLDVVSEYQGSINDFFVNYWKATYPEDSVSGATLYKKYLNRFGDINDRSEYLALLDNLLESVKIYYFVTKPNRADFSRQEKKPQYIGLDAINKLGITQIKSLLLTLYTKKETMKLNNDKLNDVINKIANYQLALFGTDSHIRSNLFTSPYKITSIAIKKAKNQSDVFSALYELIDIFKKNINEQVFIDSFTKLTFLKSSARKGLNSFPASYALHQISSSMNSEHNLNDDSITIEHIIDEKNQNEHVARIGNLSILEKNIHDEINRNGIDTYSDKKAYYSNSFSIMIDNLVKEYSDFNLGNIDSRGKKLAKYYYDNCLG